MTTSSRHYWASKGSSHDEHDRAGLQRSEDERDQILLLARDRTEDKFRGSPTTHPIVTTGGRWASASPALTVSAWSCRCPSVRASRNCPGSRPWMFRHTSCRGPPRSHSAP